MQAVCRFIETVSDLKAPEKFNNDGIESGNMILLVFISLLLDSMIFSPFPFS